ncbi:MAG: response regulator transcription factor [Oscillospiraceae bacterium]|nr:response regulator transcription factor [Oscillospiraceae bacterium]
MADDPQLSVPLTSPNDGNGVVLLIEDNAVILDMNTKVLEKDGYNVLTAETLAAAREVLSLESPDVIVLDIMLPDGDGVDFMPELRELTAAPVLFLTAKDKAEERLVGFSAGGVAYISKPYDIEEFRLRIRNFMSLMRAFEAPASVITLGSIKIDLVGHRALLNGVDMGLPPKEFAMLILFIQNFDTVLDTTFIYEKIWGHPMHDDTYSVKKAVSRLRLKLDESDFIITTHRGTGYCLCKE